VQRQPPSAPSDSLDVYVRTYDSLLRSSGDVPVRAFEEAHLFSDSSLHAGARLPTPDVAAFAYSAARLPECMPRVRRLILGQSHEQFENAGFAIREWPRVRTRGRRRPLQWNEQGTLAVFVSSTSDIDDLVPIVTAWQIEWNKLRGHLLATEFGRQLPAGGALPDDATLATGLGLDAAGLTTLREALGSTFEESLRAMVLEEQNLTLRLLKGTWNEYQRAAQRWWGAIEQAYVRAERPRRVPVYFVSSNTHVLVNLLGGYAKAHLDEMEAFVETRNPEGLAPVFRAARRDGDDALVANLSYYLLRAFVHERSSDGAAARSMLREWDAQSGIRTIEVPGKIDVDAQVVRIRELLPERFDTRVQVPGIERLRESDAVILNIDYPLGMAAYHHLSRVAQGVGDMLGIYVMGKAATLNARVGDVMLSSVVHDGHSQNTYLFRNAFSAADLQPYLRSGSVLDNQRAVTVRGAFLQNRDTLGSFYHAGYTVLEMEAGPYLSAIHELVSPRRHPDDELVHLSHRMPFDFGLLHYASDTPYSRRQSLLSKSLSYFGIDSTYACSVAIVRRILALEVERLSAASRAT
jgi:hypothetical protein